MSDIELFPRDAKVGVFRGFRDGGMEFHADLTLPHRPEFQNSPMHGQFVLVELDTPDEAILGRITALSSDGKLSAGSGEEYNIRALEEDRAVPLDILTRYLRYRVNIRVLGVLRTSPKGLTFVASLRRLPPAGSAVAFPTGPVLRQITGHDDDGVTIGHLALGEFFFGPHDQANPDWMRPQAEQAQVTFSAANLVSRRSFIFARAGFGKSNLTKLLFSSLYAKTPTVTKRHGHKVPVGSVLFDPDGEYFWPDDKGRPGFCDVPGMDDQLIVFTDRHPPSSFYGSFVAAGTRLDLRRLRAHDVVGIFLPPGRQEQQNVIKLRSLNDERWGRLVDLVHVHRYDTDLDDIKEILRLEPAQEMEALAARTNAVRIVTALHDPSSLFLEMLLASLREGKLCIVDVSLKSREQALVLSGLVLRRIFDNNQEEFTAAEPRTIPTIAIVEEAQAVLNDKAAAAQPYIEWVKEGRKYDLGAVLVTQQPGSIPNEILSQGDNWFLFHLLSAGDLNNVNAANAHFGRDILSSLLNEPIPGQGVFWSSAAERQYPVPMRVIDFEGSIGRRDPDYTSPAIDTYAASLIARVRTDFLGETATSTSPAPTPSPASAASRPGTTPIPPLPASGDDSAPAPDMLRTVEQRAIEAFAADDLFSKLKNEGLPWGAINGFFSTRLPDTLDNKRDFAYKLVPKALNQLLGRQNHAWETFPSSSGATWVRLKN